MLTVEPSYDAGVLLGCMIAIDKIVEGERAKREAYGHSAADDIDS